MNKLARLFFEVDEEMFPKSLDEKLAEKEDHRDSVPCEDDRESIYDDDFSLQPMEQLPF